jgi:hypothetical protein
MRTRGNLGWFLLGTALCAASQMSCASDRKYNQATGEDAGNKPGAAIDASSTGDNGDAQVGAEGGIGNNSSSDGDELTVTAGAIDGAIADGADGGSAVGSSGGSDADANVATSDSEHVSSGDASDSSVSTTGSGDSGSGSSCTPVDVIESDCGNNQDEDCDGLNGCEDVDDCGENVVCQPACAPSTETEQICDDEADDDCDGFKDCEDTDCALDLHCLVACVPSAEDCSDGEDNDCDGFEDCADSTCAATAGCCIAEGDEVCNDGIDNDCDGVVDCPVITSTVPALPSAARTNFEGGAVSADKATINLATPMAQDYVVQCRSAKPAQVSAERFGVCDAANPSALTVKPFPLVEGPNAEHDGLTTTQVRFAYLNGQVSQPVEFTYYVHSSIYGAEACVPKADDDDYFAAAASYLLNVDSPTFDDADARLAAPFVNVAFTPAANATFQVAEGEGAVEYLSLRRRFVLNADKNLVLMKRVFTSRSNPATDCRAATIRKHDSDGGFLMRQYYRTPCDAIVLNREGAGLCLGVDESNAIVVANPNSYYWQAMFSGIVNWAQADNFMWRKLRSDGTGTIEVFSSKCHAGGSSCVDGNQHALYLPDHELFDL